MPPKHKTLRMVPSLPELRKQDRYNHFRYRNMFEPQKKLESPRRSPILSNEYFEDTRRSISKQKLYDDVSPVYCTLSGAALTQAKLKDFFTSKVVKNKSKEGIIKGIQLKGTKESKSLKTLLLLPMHIKSLSEMFKADRQSTEFEDPGMKTALHTNKKSNTMDKVILPRRRASMEDKSEKLKEFKFA